jgi:16S rRNA (cytosine967-C5)-methyltransferase
MRRTMGVPPASSPRGLAWEILNRIDRDGAFAEPLLDAFLSGTSMKEEDRRLLTDLVYGTVRMRNRLDWVIGKLYRGKPAAMDPALRNLLRLGFYQILMRDRIPAFAVVHETVEMAKRTRPGREKLVNALLRNVIRSAGEISYPDRESDPEGFISVYHSHPLWLVRRWVGQFGAEETVRLCSRNNEPPGLTLRVHPSVDPEQVIGDLAGLGVAARRGRFAPGAVAAGGKGGKVREYVLSRRGGKVAIQDEASQLVAGLVRPLPGESVLDLCAGTGRKALQMAGAMGNRGEILAVDLNGRKLEILRETAEEAGCSILRTLEGDGTVDLGARFHERFDKVLVDAPCTGTGTVRRKPEIRWRLDEGDPGRMALLQAGLLRAAARYVKPGGWIVYGTCSLLREENEDVVERFPGIGKEFRWLDLTPFVPGELLWGERIFRTFPHRHDMDGFTAVVLQRTDEKGA